MAQVVTGKAISKGIETNMALQMLEVFDGYSIDYLIKAVEILKDVTNCTVVCNRSDLMQAVKEHPGYYCDYLTKHKPVTEKEYHKNYWR